MRLCMRLHEVTMRVCMRLHEVTFEVFEVTYETTNDLTKQASEAIMSPMMQSR